MLKTGSVVLGMFLGAVAIASTQGQVLPASSSLAQTPPVPSVPVEAIGAVVEAFRSHSVVTLEDAHGDAQVVAFTLALIRDPRFLAVVNDLIVETGNARYQDLMDRYVQGDDVPLSALRHVWEDHTVSSVIRHNAVIPEVYRTVREINSSRPRQRQLRILLGDPPIDWSTVKTAADHRKWIEMRDSHPAALIQLEVLSKQRRALVLYGQMHAQRRQMIANYDMDAWQAQTLVSILERTTPTRVFSVWRETNLAKILPEAASWRVPSLALVRGTTLGATDFANYSVSTLPRASIQDGKIVPLPREQWRVLPMEDQFDAVLYLGPPATTTAIPGYSPDMCAERADLEESLRRLTIGGAPGSADRLKQYCAGFTQR